MQAYLYHLYQKLQENKDFMYLFSCLPFADLESYISSMPEDLNRLIRPNNIESAFNYCVAHAFVYAMLLAFKAKLPDIALAGNTSRHLNSLERADGYFLLKFYRGMGARTRLPKISVHLPSIYSHLWDGQKSFSTILDSTDLAIYIWDADGERINDYRSTLRNLVDNGKEFFKTCLDVCISKDFSALGVVSIKSFDFDYIENAVTLVFTNDKHVEVSLNTYYTYVDPTKSIFDQDDCLVVIQSNSKPTFGDYFEANDKYYKNICLRDFSKNFISELYNFVF